MDGTRANAVIETALRQDVEKLDRLIDRQRKRLDGLVASRDAIVATLEYRRPTQKRARKPVNLHVTAEEIEGMSVADAAVLIARRNGGRIRSTPARELMKKAAILPPDGRASTRLYHFLSNSGKFESIDRGVYQLDENYEPEPDVDPADLEMLERLRRGDSFAH